MPTEMIPPTPELLYLLSADPAELAETLSGMRGADVAEALNALRPDVAAKVLTALPFDLAVRVCDQPELEHMPEIFAALPAETAAAIIEAMSADRQADLFRDMAEPTRERMLDAVDEPTRHALRLLLRYPPDTAGGIMTTEFVSVPSTWTVDQVLRHITEVGRSKETVYVVYVVDAPGGRLVRAVSLRDLLVAPRAQLAVDAGDRRHPLTVTPMTTREDAARLIAKYNLLAVPVVDEAQHVLGIVTVDDVIDAIVHDLTADVERFGGVETLEEPYMEIGFWTMIRKRGGWLCALFLSEMLTATAMQHFEGEIAKAVVLSMFIPLVMSSGGNSGSQATSLVIRALALREVRVRDWWRVALREIPTGIALGCILGVIGIARILLWQHTGLFDYGPSHDLIALTVGVALVGIVGFGSLAGSMLPFLLKKLGFDPASASAPFVATLVDVTGIVIYFTVAFLILRGTLL